MKSISIALALVGAVVMAGATPVVVPNDRANTAGNSSFLLFSGDRTYQWIIGASQLTGLAGQELQSFSFRLQPSAPADWPADPVSFSSFDVRLSGAVNPADRSNIFADNVVGPQTLVRSGALNIPAFSYSSGGNPNDFGLEVSLGDYLYTGGNLLIELRYTGYVGTTRSFDAVTSTQAGYGTDFAAAWGSGYAATQAITTTANFIVTQITPVPEPATMLALGAGAAALIARRRRKIA